MWGRLHTLVMSSEEGPSSRGLELVLSSLQSRPPAAASGQRRARLRGDAQLRETARLDPGLRARS